ncbi:MAG: hypothetical protein ACREVN_01085 [Gammaproteobacteria bacterium]
MTTISSTLQILALSDTAIGGKRQIHENKYDKYQQNRDEDFHLQILQIANTANHPAIRAKGRTGDEHDRDSGDRDSKRGSRSGTGQQPAHQADVGGDHDAQPEPEIGDLLSCDIELRHRRRIPLQ